MATTSSSILALLAVLGTAAAVSAPLLEPLAQTIGGQIQAQLDRLEIPGSSQPAWLTEVNRRIEEAARSIDERVIVPAVIGAGVLASLGVTSASCSDSERQTIIGSSV